MSPDLIATAAHVVEAMQKQTKGYPDGYMTMVAEKYSEDGVKTFSRNIDIVYSDEPSDLALLKLAAQPRGEVIKNDEAKPLRIAKALPEVGEEIVQTGFTDLSSHPFTAMGTIAMITGPKEEGVAQEHQNVIFSDITSIPGNSGGPIFSLKTGQVVGIATRRGNSSRFAVAAKSNGLLEMIEKYELSIRGDAPR